MNRFRRFNLQGYLFLTYLLILISVYSFYLLTFTLFDGFTTFSNDAASYVLLARKWSPFFIPSDAETYTWPLQALPPGFPWMLAITGASESLWSSHLMVSIFMLGSLILIGWMAYKSLGWVIGGLLILAFCILPSVITSSMGILSENPYLFLSLAVLLNYSRIKNNENAAWGWYVLVLVFLSFSVLTRTIGIALIAAVFLATLLDKELARKQKRLVYLSVILSVAIWQISSVFNPQPSELTYGYYIEHYFGSEPGVYSILVFLLDNFRINSAQILSSWGHYLSLNHTNFWFFLFAYILLILSIMGLGLRLLQRKLDAIYVALYLITLLIWPHPGEMTRFLHPIVFLLLMQPMVYLAGNTNARNHLLSRNILIVVILVFIGNSTIIQVRMSAQRNVARNSNPDLSHSYEFYDFPSRDAGMYQAINFARITKYLEKSAQYVPSNGVVATIKHVNYAILTNKRAVNLVAIVSDLQQLCNLKIKDVDLIFLSDLTTKFNKEGTGHMEKYEDISSDIWMESGQDGKAVAYSIAIDKEKLNSKLENSGYDCQNYQAQL